ncbi:hypothetical protein PENANT_c001G01332 [Penicillium antarcticum]|uniref:Uncharacterized protein n=1 Tax=Penicillium antarcticum TaxID=416450 RepID=A0A1V6QP97_9EURO|nr:hypothetical protein PENANT_c001G01332 [Penicillium antarcticum]
MPDLLSLLRNFKIPVVLWLDTVERHQFGRFTKRGLSGDTEQGRDLNRFRSKYNAYKKLVTAGACESNFARKFYGFINQVNAAAFHPAFQHFAHDKFQSSAILLESLSDVENLNVYAEREDSRTFDV